MANVDKLDVVITIEKDNNLIKPKLNLENLKNNEILIYFDDLDNKRFDTLFDSSITIYFKFNFDDINSQILYLFFIIKGLKKYKPKGIHLTLPYFPYTDNDKVINNEGRLTLPTHFGFLSMLENNDIASITTYDIWNPDLQDYSDIYLNTVKKEEIYSDIYDFFSTTVKPLFIIALNNYDYNDFYNKYGEKNNIKLLNCSTPINFRSTREIGSSFLNIIKKNPTVPIYIFDKHLVTGSKIFYMLKYILKDTDIKEINIYITHAIFANGSYKKFNALFEKYSDVSITIYTTDSIFGFKHLIDKKFIDLTETNSVTGEIEEDIIVDPEIEELDLEEI